MKAKYHISTIHFPHAVWEKIRKEAAKLGTSASCLVRMATIRYLADQKEKK